MPLPPYIVLPLSQSVSVFHVELQAEQLLAPRMPVRRFRREGYYDYLEEL